MVISIVNQKGGGGKTTTAVNLSAALAEQGLRVLLIDMDAQHNATTVVGVSRTSPSIFDVLVDGEAHPLHSVVVSTPVPHLDVAPGAPSLSGLDLALRDAVGRDLLLREAIASLPEPYDFVLIDNGPTLGIAPVMSLCAADVALIPLQCEPLALEGLSQILKTISKIRSLRINTALQTQVLLTMLDLNTQHGREIRDETRRHFTDTVLRTEVRRFVRLAKSAVRRDAAGQLKTGTVLATAPNSPAANAYRDLARELQQRHLPA